MLNDDAYDDGDDVSAPARPIHVFCIALCFGVITWRTEYFILFIFSWHTTAKQ